MKRSQINPMPQYYDYYINLVADVELSDAFDRSIRQLNDLDRDRLTGLDGQAYAPDKWTVKEILQHVIDFERILSYRSLLFARGVGSNPQDIDPHLLARDSLSEARTIEALIDELKALRLAMGFMMIGHQIHHLKVIEEKYFPLLDQHVSNATISQ